MTPTTRTCTYCGGPMPRRASPTARFCSRSCACRSGIYRLHGHRGGLAVARVRLRALMLRHGWSEREARCYMDGWRAGARTAWGRFQRHQTAHNNAA